MKVSFVTHGACLVLLASMMSAGAAPSFPVVKQISGPGRQLALTVAVDRAGNFAIAGSLEGSADFGGGALAANKGDRDMFVAKYDRRGNYLWSKRFGTDGDDLFIQARFDSTGNLVLAGEIGGKGADFGGGIVDSKGQYDIILLKLAPDGSYLWAKRFGDDGYQRADAMDIDAHDNIVLVGTFGGHVDFGSGALSGNAYLAKFGSDGEALFSRAFSVGGHFLEFDKVAVSRNGEIALSGVFSGEVNLGGDPFTTADTSTIRTVVASFSSTGTHLWSKAYPALGSALAFGPGGELYAWLYIRDPEFLGYGRDSVIFRFDSSGDAVLWKHFGEDLFPTMENPSLVVDNSGTVSLVGSIDGYTDFGGIVFVSQSYDIAFARYDANGRLICSALYGDKKPQFIAALATTPDDGLVLAGSFDGSIRIGDVSLYDSDGSASSKTTEQTEEDIFFAIMDPTSPPPPRRHAAR